jgi:uncharacterized protein YbjT (DUF2867 family)
MKILLTGSTGYIGRRLLPVLLADGHEIVCLIRDKRRFDWADFSEQELRHLHVVEGDLTQPSSLREVPVDFDAAYYLVHSMSSGSSNFATLESDSAHSFVDLIHRSQARQVIYLSGIVNDVHLSHHLESRRQVEEILKTSRVPVTVLRAAIIIGSGSASFEIIRDLVEKLPIMIAPRWLNTRCQPIGIRNVMEYLRGVLFNPETYDQNFDIGGADILTYKEMLMNYAAVRNLRRSIITVPVLTPRLSSLWLYLVTSTSISLARTLVDSMKNEVICNDNRIQRLVPVRVLSYQEALKLAFEKISQRNVISSWKDSISLDTLDGGFLNNIRVPEHGVLVDQRIQPLMQPVTEVVDTLWRIGGNTGWYYGNWMWRIRGILDKLVGGVGLRRGRRSEVDLKTGDALDFWRVLIADKEHGRLLLFAEMKLPGEAWLEFKIDTDSGRQVLQQTATFRPLGLWGRLYWYLMLPFHGLIFPNMARAIATHKKKVAAVALP